MHKIKQDGKPSCFLQAKIVFDYTFKIRLRRLQPPQGDNLLSLELPLLSLSAELKYGGKGNICGGIIIF